MGRSPSGSYGRAKARPLRCLLSNSMTGRRGTCVSRATPPGWRGC